MTTILNIVNSKRNHEYQKSPIPLEIRVITKDELQQKKAQKDEELHQACIQEVIQWLYRRIIGYSEYSTNKCYKLLLKPFQQNPCNGTQDLPYVTFIQENQEVMLTKIRSLFPDSVVEIKTLSRAPDGNMYDTSSLDQSVLHFIDRKHDQSFLIVDYS